jgi:hypothetical protein
MPCCQSKIFSIFTPALKGIKQMMMDKETEIWHTLRAKLSWSHIRLIMRIENKEIQKYHLQEAAKNHWSVRTLDRNISTL